MAVATPEPRKSRSLTAQRARELLIYNPKTGVLRRRAETRRPRRYPEGRRIRTINKDGHPIVKLDGTCFICSRVIFLMMTGRWPDPACIHRDNNQTNLRWDNLREASFVELTHNRRVYKEAA